MLGRYLENSWKHIENILLVWIKVYNSYANHAPHTASAQISLIRVRGGVMFIFCCCFFQFVRDNIQYYIFWQAIPNSITTTLPENNYFLDLRYFSVFVKWNGKWRNWSIINMKFLVLSQVSFNLILSREILKSDFNSKIRSVFFLTHQETTIKEHLQIPFPLFLFIFPIIIIKMQ